MLPDTESGASRVSVTAGTIALFVAVRIASLWAFHRAAGGREVASDVDFHGKLIADPLAVLLGRAAFDVASYPPLQGFLEWPLFRLFETMSGEVLAFRLMMMTFELASLVVLLHVLNRSSLPSTVRVLVPLLFAIAPQQLLTSVVLSQDEVMGQLFVLLALAHLQRQRRVAALLTLALGACAAKIFLLVPLFFVWAFHGRPSLLGRLLDGAAAGAIVAAVYGVSIVNALEHGGAVPLVGFTPFAEYSSNAWVIAIGHAPESIGTLKEASLLLCALTQLLLLLWLRRRPPGAGLEGDATLLAVPLLLLFATFFQHNPEYLLLFWPVILIGRHSIATLVIASAVVAFAFVPRLLFGFKNAALGVVNATTSDTRNELLGGTLARFADELVAAHLVSLLLHTLLYTSLTLWFVARVGRERVSLASTAPDRLRGGARPHGLRIE